MVSLAELSRVGLASRVTLDWPLVFVAWGKKPLIYSIPTAAFAAMLRPFQADSTETLWCLLCCVVLELCRRAKLTDGGTAPTRHLPVAQEWGLPSGAAGAEATPPTSSAASAAALEDITDVVEMDPVLVANDAEVLTSAEIMYNPFDRPSDEEVVEAIPRDRSRSHSRSRSA